MSVNDHTSDFFAIGLTSIAIFLALVIAIRQSNQSKKIEDALYEIQVFKDTSTE